MRGGESRRAPNCHWCVISQSCVRAIMPFAAAACPTWLYYPWYQSIVQVVCWTFRATIQEATVTEKIGFAAVSRRDAIRLIAATPASGAVLAASLPGAASAKAIASAAAATGQHSLGSAAARQSLADLAAAHFEPLVGQTFSVAGEAATLTEVRRGRASRAPFRQQFALTFRRRGTVMCRQTSCRSRTRPSGATTFTSRKSAVRNCEICFS